MRWSWGGWRLGSWFPVNVDPTVGAAEPGESLPDSSWVQVWAGASVTVIKWRAGRDLLMRALAELGSRQGCWNRGLLEGVWAECGDVKCCAERNRRSGRRRCVAWWSLGVGLCGPMGEASGFYADVSESYS